MFTVAGRDRDGIGYHVAVGVDGGEKSPSRAGIVSGSLNAVALLREREGETFGGSPTGPFRKLDLNDALAVLTALYALTDVSRVEGDDVPEVVPPPEEGVIY